jgi:dTMP kinase
MRNLEFFGTTLPNAPKEISGRLIVIEGPDNSGRSTQIDMLRNWLEREGHAVVDVGLKRSTLVSEELDQAMQGNVLGAVTFTLFYATDFLDQVENKILPALRAGFIVLCDRYIYTLIARATVRGLDSHWISGVYNVVPKPDAVFYLRVDPTSLLERRFQQTPTLDYWESGMDIGLSSDMYVSFYRYQTLMQQEFQRLAGLHAFQVLDGTKSLRSVHKQIRDRLAPMLEGQLRPRRRLLPTLKRKPAAKAAPKKKR